MTQALCFRCGDIKHGAFGRCDSCDAQPSTDDELMVSLAFSDHYFDSLALRQLGQDVKAGNGPTLGEEIKSKLRPAIVEYKRIAGLGAANHNTSKPTQTRSPYRTLNQKLFGFFARRKGEPPLTQFCIRLSELLLKGDFLEYLKGVISKAPAGLERHAVVLSLVAMALAGNFVSDLRHSKQSMYRDVREFFKDTNAEIITAEQLFGCFGYYVCVATATPPAATPTFLQGG